MSKKNRTILVFTDAIQSTFSEFFRRSSSAGIVILAATAIAMLWVNSPFGDQYHALLDEHVKIDFFALHTNFTIEQFVNDGLMVIFFMVVGLEIKRELLVGELASAKKAALPMVAALFGMIVPAAIYAYFNFGTEAIRGWGVPVATDIAFALGILALFGKRVPLGLKVFLAALAIVDDLLAVLIIAVFYTADLNVAALGVAAITLVVLYVGNRLGVHTVKFYAIMGFVLWVAILYSGIHATIAGVLLALTIPAEARLNVDLFTKRARSLVTKIDNDTTNDQEEGVQADAIHNLEHMCEEVQSPLARIEHGLSHYVSFLVMPIFAFANSGVHLEASVMSQMGSPSALGIIFGLFIGKQIGVTAAVWASIKLGIAEMPTRVNLKMVYGVSLLCGIGFTMALFVGHLAFPTDEMLSVAKLSILIGSGISALGGAIALFVWLPKKRRSNEATA